ncbi:hypothetical protein BZG02_04440 [Labilibaculum filiforme]|uniref:Uncharacterized protein n=1 Tax=Labilibaculum filiforme TaxID=1940526 RepID=A0A2N3I4A0_9BACT|nr:hypothetical protein [Labilibaculum filiforme]PKQ65083.1 hypothetical protein BZG02_04440 [Labilibaculum filiforme]
MEMSKKEDIYKDDFVKELMNNIDLVEPSDQFTNKVMDSVMQDWLAKPIEMKKPISRNQWIWISGLILLVVLILLGTDVRTLVNATDNVFLNQLDNTFLQPIHHILSKVFESLIQLPAMVYIIAIAFAGLAAFDRIAHKLLQH